MTSLDCPDGQSVKYTSLTITEVERLDPEEFPLKRDRRSGRDGKSQMRGQALTSQRFCSHQLNRSAKR